jgi:hypothetical protein
MANNVPPGNVLPPVRVPAVIIPDDQVKFRACLGAKRIGFPAGVIQFLELQNIVDAEAFRDQITYASVNGLLEAIGKPGAIRDALPPVPAVGRNAPILAAAAA